MWSDLLGNLTLIIVGMFFILMRGRAIEFLKSFFSTETVTPTVEKIMLIFYLILGIGSIVIGVYGLYQIISR